MAEQERPRSRSSAWLWLAAASWAGGTVLAYVELDWVLATFIAIVGLTLVAMAFAARNWDQHSTYEEREAARARRRKERWDRGAAARARDRARWEAHQAKQAQRTSDQP